MFRSISWSPDFKSMMVVVVGGGGIKWLIFSQMLVVIANSTMNDISPDHPRLPRCKFCRRDSLSRDSREVMWRHQRSSKCFFLPIASHRKELQHHAFHWSHYVQYQDTLNDIHVDLKVTLSLRSRELRSIFDFDLMRPSYSYSDAYQ